MGVAGSSSRSFRDPDAFLLALDGRLLRAVRSHAVADFRQTLEEPVIRRWMREGRLARTESLPRDDWPDSLAGFDGDCYEHEPLPFVSHPGEWTPEMLAAAGRLTLELAIDLLPGGRQLKDATPANVLFRGPEPVFVDLPSIVRREAGNCLWSARHQFETTFLMPLVASAEAGLPLAWTLSNTSAGLSHLAVARIIGARRWLRPRLIRSVALPAALAARPGPPGAPAMRARSEKQARFILERGYRGLASQLRNWSARIADRDSQWLDYTTARMHYGDADLAVKRDFVTAAVDRHRPSWVLDIGANTGEFSELAARHGQVVALDVDERAVQAIYRTALERGLPILPLVGNFGRPTPGLGWNNGETESWMARAAGRFDLVLMLAVTHHLRVTEGVPLAAQFDAVAGITRRHLLVEYVPVSDPMFNAIARGREALYDDCSRAGFEQALGARFQVEQSADLPNGRALFLARRRDR